jgi:hypothetical protein
MPPEDKFCIAGESCPWFQSFVEIKEAHKTLLEAYNKLEERFDKSWRIWIDHGQLAEKTWQDWDRFKDQTKKEQ